LDFGRNFWKDFRDFRENFELFGLILTHFAIVVLQSEVGVDIAVFSTAIAMIGSLFVREMAFGIVIIGVDKPCPSMIRCMVMVIVKSS
jgi:hypothetical protein